MQQRKRLRMLRGREDLHGLPLLTAGQPKAPDESTADAEWLREGERQRWAFRVRQQVSLRQRADSGAVERVVQ
ncbi:unnamed protein product [Linum tenue]|uniref:Uncharacterized protein n=1 Tax=Linum tenue TaxID=586396 RepID=A0AAV0KZF3_9ROSI|nr:unnamed protein product [Linum tenue]CAI0426284.1 unnamed protein product [Linum tenue]